jgi:predicted phosphodiesterase
LILSDERLTEVVGYALEESDAAAEEKFGISHETLRRYKREHKRLREESEETKIEQSKQRILQQIADRFNAKELEAIAKGGMVDTTKTRTVDLGYFGGDNVRFGVMTDTHIGSKYFREDWFDAAVDRFHAADVDFVCHVGDITEGMSNRPGHVYELEKLGYTDQRDESVRLLSTIGLPIYAIDGNHDRWFIKSNGAKIVPDICERVPDMHFLGHDTGELNVNGATIQMWHGEDGSSYAHSYRLQKVIEALPGGKKPNVLLSGHVHKMGYFFIRNIHAIAGGTLQEQSAWMRGKRLEAHTGFWTIEMDVRDGGVVRFTPTFYPFYY